MTESPKPDRSVSLGWASTAVLVAATLIGIIAWRGSLDGKAPVSAGVAVVTAPGGAAGGPAPRSDLRPVRAATPVLSPDIAVAHVQQAYSVLSNAALTCSGTDCVLTGRIRPPTGQADVDKRQEMLLGGLASVLAEDGYTMHVPFQMDEIDDNTFNIRASVKPSERPVI